MAAHAPGARGLLRFRPGAAALAALLPVVLGGCGRSLMGDTRPKIVILFGADPDGFEGLDVVIDGQVAGQLKKFGENPRTAFQVDKGEHTVLVRHPEYRCRTAKVNAEHATMSYTLLLELGETVRPDGRRETMLLFQN